MCPKTSDKIAQHPKFLVGQIVGQTPVGQTMRHRGRLTAKTVANLGAGRYSDGGGVGLILYVEPSGGRRWIQRTMIHGKRREIGLGGWPAVSLAEARDKAIDNARAIDDGRDPLAERRRQAQDARKRLTFEEAARLACEELKVQWRSPKEAPAFISSMHRWVFPGIGKTDVVDVTPADIRQVLLRVRKAAPNTATKVQHRVLSVFKWAVAEGYRTDNPAASDALALPKANHVKKNNRALSHAEVGAALKTIDNSTAHVGTKNALRFLILTAGRSGEIRGATWDEIDLDRRIWTIPAARMKVARDHRVPLSDQAMEVLALAAGNHAPGGLVFGSAQGKALSDNTLTKCLRDNNVPSTAHGFRSSFRSWCQDMEVTEEVAELCLAHVNSDRTRAAYARSDVLEQRRRVLHSWAAYVTGAEPEPNVVRMESARA